MGFVLLCLKDKMSTYLGSCHLLALRLVLVFLFTDNYLPFQILLPEVQNSCAEVALKDRRYMSDMSGNRGCCLKLPQDHKISIMLLSPSRPQFRTLCMYEMGREGDWRNQSVAVTGYMYSVMLWQLQLCEEYKGKWEHFSEVPLILIWKNGSGNL